MQAAKKAVETIKETAANIGASAKSGLEKTKATVQEKSEKMSARDPTAKDMATQKKEERIKQAEMEKQEAREQNAAAKQSAVASQVTEAQAHKPSTGPTGTETAAFGAHPTTGGGPGQLTGHNQMSTMPVDGHGPATGLANDGLTEDVAGSNPIGPNTGMSTTLAHNVPVGGSGTAPGSGPNSQLNNNNSQV